MGVVCQFFIGLCLYGDTLCKMFFSDLNWGEVCVLYLKNIAYDLFKWEHWKVPDPAPTHSGQVSEQRGN